MPLPVTFLFAGVLAAGAAAAAPVIIHLIMRTKPRELVFPPLRFVTKSHRANISKLKLKHLLLLRQQINVAKVKSQTKPTHVMVVKKFI